MAAGKISAYLQTAPYGRGSEGEFASRYTEGAQHA
jgi:hypothetical protein